jgi:hypothetical protein
MPNCGNMPFFWLIFGITEGNAERFSHFREIFSARLQERGGEKEREEERTPTMIERKNKRENLPQ